MSAEDLDTLKSYGRCVEYDVKVEGNMDISTLQFDYLLLDLRVKEDRVYFDSQKIVNMNVICLISLLEKFDAFIDNLGCDNVITELPSKQHFRSDFDSLLLKKATESPSKCLSVINFGMNFFGSLKEK